MATYNYYPSSAGSCKVCVSLAVSRHTRSPRAVLHDLLRLAALGEEFVQAACDSGWWIYERACVDRAEAEKLRQRLMDLFPAVYQTTAVAELRGAGLWICDAAKG
jgi:hypothetical protein